MLYRVMFAVLLSGSLLVGAARPVSAAPDPDGSLIALAQNLSLEVTETGPDQLWTLHLSNLGDFPIGLVADPGLLWFQVDVPGQTASRTCRLPEPLWPKTMRRRAQMVLEPGERFSRRFDPRFFCFADLVQAALVPGARVAPHFGWPHETRVVRVKGQRVTETLPPAAPFVAWAIDAEAAPGEPNASAEATDPPETDGEGREDETSSKTPTEGVKQVVGSSFVISPAYAKWSQPLPHLPPGLHALVLAGADAEDERNVTLTVSVTNTSNMTQQIFIRRELFSYMVIGPDGTFDCPTSDLGPPDTASFTSLGPRGSERLAVRLIEMCPRGGFARPGLYEVHATLQASYSGAPVGIDAFVGTLEAPRPALVRVRSGDRSSFLRAAPMLAGANRARGAGPAGSSGAAPPAPGGAGSDAPTDGAPEAPLPEEVPPPEHDAPAVPEEAPALPPPAEGTAIE